jgi:hypothetical protein
MSLKKTIQVCLIMNKASQKTFPKKKQSHVPRQAQLFSYALTAFRRSLSLYPSIQILECSVVLYRYITDNTLPWSIFVHIGLQLHSSQNCQQKNEKRITHSKITVKIPCCAEEIVFFA